MEAASPRINTLEALYDAHSKAVYWTAFTVTRDRELAADVMQNVFLSAHRHMEKLAQLHEDQVRAWLYRSAVNGGIDLLRRSKRLVVTENAGVLEPDGAAGPAEEAERNETRAAVRRALTALPEKYGRPLMLYYFAELDYKQIAALLDMNEGTLKSRMSRGRAMLEKSLGKEGGIHV